MLIKDEIESLLERVQDWTKAVDQKVSVFLAFQGIVLSILFPKAYVWAISNIYRFNRMEVVMLAMGGVLVALSLYKSVSAITPRLKHGHGKKSVIFFHDIAARTVTAFKSEIHNLTAAEYDEDMLNQVHASSVVATRKHAQFRDAIGAFFIGMIVLIALFAIVKL